FGISRLKGVPWKRDLADPDIRVSGKVPLIEAWAEPKRGPNRLDGRRVAWADDEIWGYELDWAAEHGIYVCVPDPATGLTEDQAAGLTEWLVNGAAMEPDAR